jgi:hypothetical protein
MPMVRVLTDKLYGLVVIAATVMLGASVATAQPSAPVYALYVMQATTDSQGNAIAACQVVDRILWDGVTAYSPPPWGSPPVPTALVLAGSLQIGQSVTGAPPICP